MYVINLGQGQFWKYRTNDPMVTIAAIDLKHYQDGRHTHLG